MTMRQGMSVDSVSASDQPGRAPHERNLPRDSMGMAQPVFANDCGIYQSECDYAL